VTDLLGHLGYVVLIVGLILIGRKHPTGWLVRIVGELIWVALGISMGMTSIWIWGLIFTAISYHHWRNWKCDSSNREATTASATGP